MKVSVHCVFLGTLMASCGLSAGESVSRRADANEPLACATGKLTAFQFGALGSLPDARTLQLGRDLPWRLETPSAEDNLRLDVCFDEQQIHPAVLRRVVSHKPFQPENVYPVNADSVVRGLDEALFGDFGSLEIRVGDAQGSGLLIKGQKEGDVEFAAAVPISFGEQGWEITSITVLVGNLILGDPFAQALCEAGQVFVQSEFSLGTAKFSAEFCSFLGGGETTGYTIRKLTVVDSNADLAPELRGPRTFEGEELKRVLEFRWNHHNACDSFVLALPEVRYAATSAPLAGCGSTLPDAPPRDMLDERTGTLFRVKYGSRDWGMISEVSCRHYLFGCE